ncbi:preprotein translocase subunit SecA [Jeotgalibacillus alimentarius]|uniref:Protein translocase subunit SecA n=1 Tax=Jeotgalibacillus alimentarius TaxID=135826 RepID=A0A0C2RSC1_9BACL|nr:accessory Sec system translocase SecA2 [Jeotgalibacillus alimentarius]KIL44649.1 preprotein translocase subunit SecA [Jeotgalibacillus alimentarius]
MISFIQKLKSSGDDRQLKKYRKLAEQINALESRYEAYSDQELREQTTIFKERVAQGEALSSLRNEAFAVVREASKRVLGMRHFDVQMIGGIALSDNNIAEMPTGEGKTLVASLPSYLHALEGKGVHVITVNEYLARRDRDLIGQVHEFLGLDVSLNIPGLEPDRKRMAYAADITYGIGSEFGFDYLRDNMVYETGQRVQRPLHYAIIDEADSVLIDEAKTPLIIAGKDGISTDLSYLCARIVKNFEEGREFHYDLETKTTNLTEDGISSIERGFDIDNLYELEHQTLYHYVIQALRARVMFQRDVDYIVKEGKILLIDMFTGRPMEGRTLSNGLHQAIEAKEGLEVTEENKTQASITIQNYFRRYEKLSGMTGTAKTEQKELRDIYNLGVVQVPTNKPIAREDLPDRIYETVEQKYQAAADRAEELHDAGRPVLIGTTSIIQSELVSKELKKRGLAHELLNAKSLEQEVRLISLAGQKGSITVATNMAGRGTDIVLGEGVRELGGLYVIGTERHEARRIDNQLKGRSGRQGDPGTSEFFISLDDEMYRRFAPEELEKLKKNISSDKNGEVKSKKAKEFVDRVQRICEGSNFSIREYNLKLDDVLGVQRATIYDLRDKLLERDAVHPILKNIISSHAMEEVRLRCPEDEPDETWDRKQMKDNLKLIVPTGDFSFINEDTPLKKIQQSVKEQTDVYVNLVDEHLQEESFSEQLRKFLLGRTDHYWLRHIDAMDRLKEGVGLRSYSQEDPMRQYQREGLELFSMMYYQLEQDVSRQTAQLIHKIETTKKNGVNVK